MSVASCVAFVGVRYEVPADEIDGLEMRSDPRIMAAKRAGLHFYWGNFGGSQDKYLLFLGRELVLLGHENADRFTASGNELAGWISDVQTRMSEAGLEGAAALHLEYQPDI